MLTSTLNKAADETELQYIWRICELKANGLLDETWDHVADILNSNLHDPDDYLSASAYRKKYQGAKAFYNEVFCLMDSKDYKRDFQEQKQDIRKERQKLSDERIALNKKLRDNARLEQDLETLQRMIAVNGKTVFPESNNKVKEALDDNSLIVCLSDLHLGLDVKNSFGEYNYKIAFRRLCDYVDEIKKLQEIYKAKNCYVVCLGDLISGNIHYTTQLENRENVINQVQTASEYIAAFVYELSTFFNDVYVTGVAGNHSRLGFKDSVIRDERLDNIIPWYMKAKLSHISSIHFIDENNYDATIGWFEIQKRKYLVVHGDFDQFSESGISKLVLMLGFAPSAIFYGHLHHCSFDDIANIKIIRSGCLCGSVDDFAISKRLTGLPAQMVCVANSQGISSIIPVNLK